MLLLIPGKLSLPPPPPQLFSLKRPSERVSPDTCPELGPSSFLPQHSVHFPHRLCNNFFGVATFLWFEGFPPRRTPTLTLLEAPWRPFLQRPLLPWPLWYSCTSHTLADVLYLIWSLKPHFTGGETEVSRDTVYGWRGQWSSPDLLTLSPDFKAVHTPRLPLWSSLIWLDFLGE